MVNKYTAAMQRAASVTTDPYLVKLGPALGEVEKYRSTIPALKSYIKDLDTLMEKPEFGVDGSLTDKFAQTLGEAHFLVMCQNKGIELRRVPEEKDRKTPDFEATFGSQSVYFEVKTLSVVSGAIGISAAQESSLEANIHTETLIKRGADTAIGTSIAQPYASKVDRDKTTIGVINTLLEKARGNIKFDQFAAPNTFLVLNLSVIPPLVTEPKALRPAYHDDYMFSKAVTGELWMIAFGDKGMLVLGTPDFEGKPCIEGVFDKVGVLVDSEYSQVAGVIFMIHPLNHPAQLFGLFRSKDWILWSDSNPDLAENLQVMTGKNWNDCSDSNGYRLV